VEELVDGTHKHQAQVVLVAAVLQIMVAAQPVLQVMQEVILRLKVMLVLILPEHNTAAEAEEPVKTAIQMVPHTVEMD
jgi:diacylglycerol kinase